MKTIAIDFETYYDKTYSLTGMSYKEYVNDRRFDAYMVTIVGEGVEFVGRPEDFDWASIDGLRWAMHNASFDEEVFLRLRELFPEIYEAGTPAEVVCTADLCSYLQLPRSLKGAMREVFQIEVDKSQRNKMSGGSSDLLATDAATMEYALLDSVYCLKLWNTLSPHWPAKERTLSQLTRECGRKGVPVDLERLIKERAALLDVCKQAKEAVPWVASGLSTSVVSMKQVKKWCSMFEIPAPKSLAKTSEDCAAWLEEHGEEFPWVKAMQTWRSANTLSLKYDAIIRATFGGRWRYQLKYCGAPHTSRWSGSGGANIQNLPRGEMYGTNLRNCLKAPDGFTLVVADLSQIEPRCIKLLTNDLRWLDIVRSGKSPYVAHGMASYNYTEERCKEPAIYSRLKMEVLLLGYGGGAVTLRTQAQAMFGTTLSARGAKSIVDDYRRANTDIVALWDSCDADLRKATRKSDGRAVFKLPSGDSLRYFNTSVGRGLTTYTVKGERKTHLWGGVAAQNITQRLGRNVFAEGLLRVQQVQDCEILFTVHDEVVCIAPLDRAEQVAEEVQAALAESPPWAPLLPVACDVQITPFYTK